MALTAKQRENVIERGGMLAAGAFNVPRQLLPDPMERRQLLLLRRIARIWAIIFTRELIDRLPQLLGRTDADRLDALSDDLRTLTTRVQKRFEQRVGSKRFIRELLISAQLVNGFNLTQVNKQFRAAFNIELDDLARQQGALEAFVNRNIRLIENLSEEQLANTREIILEAGRKGTRNEVVSKQLQERIGVVRSRANLIARDQIGTLNSQLTERRHKSLGVNSYTWRISGGPGGDGKVRDSHIVLEGLVFRYDNPPVTSDAGDVNNPGEDFNCRCTAEPVLSDAVATAAAQPIPVATAA